MRETPNFRFLVLEEGDDPYSKDRQFFVADRDKLDQLLQRLSRHRHTGASDWPETPEAPSLTLVTDPSAGGRIPAGVRLWYAVSLVNMETGEESPVSDAVYIDTPEPVEPPDQPSLAWGSSGGTLQPGIYYYVISAWTGSSAYETQASPPAGIAIPTGEVTNRVQIELPSPPVGADGFNIYRRKPGGQHYNYIASVSLDVPSPPSHFVDTGLEEDCDRVAPRVNQTHTTNAVVVTYANEEVPWDHTWKIYRTVDDTSWASSLLTHVVEHTEDESWIINPTFTDIGAATSTGSPVDTTVTFTEPDPIDLTDSLEVSGYLPMANVAGFPLSARWEFAGPVTPTVGTRQWVAPTDCRVVTVDLSLAPGSVPASTPVLVDVVAHRQWSGGSSVDEVVAQVEIPVGETVALSPEYLWDWIELQPGDSLTVDIVQSGGGATPTDYDLTVNVSLIAYGRNYPRWSYF